MKVSRMDGLTALMDQLDDHLFFVGCNPSDSCSMRPTRTAVGTLIPRFHQTTNG